MSTRTVDWTALRTPRAGEPQPEGLRERKKRLTRQQLSDTATEMFMERGFDAVRVSEIAEACGVSEKTVFNYFPTKESLILDRWDTTADSLRTGLAEPGVPPVQAALRILDGELGGMTSWLAAQDDPVQAGAQVLRFGVLIRSTPALRAHQHDATDRLIGVAAESLAQRSGLGPDDPEPQIAATALLGLWSVQFQALRKHLDGTRTPAQVHEAVTAEVHRAARLIDTGLGSSEVFTQGSVAAGNRPATRHSGSPAPNPG
jgi:AcrR family transcriptional regulator